LGAVVATDPVSVDADRDNGGCRIPCRGMRRPDAGRRGALVAREPCGEAEVDGSLPPSRGRKQAGTTPSLMFRALVGPDGDVEVAVAPFP